MEEESKIMTGLSKFKEFMIKLKKNNIITKNLSECKNFVGKLKRGPEEGESWTRIGYAIESIPKIINKISGVAFIYLYLLFIAKGGYKNFVKNYFNLTCEKCTVGDFWYNPIILVVFALIFVCAVATFFKIFKGNSLKMKIFAAISAIGIIVSGFEASKLSRICKKEFYSSHALYVKYLNDSTFANAIFCMFILSAIVLVCIANRSLFYSFLRYYFGIPLLLGFLEMPGYYLMFVVGTIVIILIMCLIVGLIGGGESVKSIGDSVTYIIEIFV